MGGLGSITGVSVACLPPTRCLIVPLAHPIAFRLVTIIFYDFTYHTTAIMYENDIFRHIGYCVLAKNH